MKLVDTSSVACKEADELYYANEIAYAVAVKRCLQTTGIEETAAIRLLNVCKSYVVEGQKGKHLPSSCASVISKLS